MNTLIILPLLMTFLITSSVTVKAQRANQPVTFLEYKKDCRTQVEKAKNLIAEATKTKEAVKRRLASVKTKKFCKYYAKVMTCDCKNKQCVRKNKQFVSRKLKRSGLPLCRPQYKKVTLPRAPATIDESQRQQLVGKMKQLKNSKTKHCFYIGWKYGPTYGPATLNDKTTKKLDDIIKAKTITQKQFNDYMAEYKWFFSKHLPVVGGIKIGQQTPGSDIFIKDFYKKYCKKEPIPPKQLVLLGKIKQFRTLTGKLCGSSSNVDEQYRLTGLMIQLQSIIVTGGLTETTKGIDAWIDELEQRDAVGVTPDTINKLEGKYCVNPPLK